MIRASIFTLVVLLNLEVSWAQNASGQVQNVSQCSQKLSSDGVEGGQILFGNGARYTTVYDIIVFYKAYVKALEYHMAVVTSVPAGGVIFEAGGGTAIMTAEAMRRNPQAKTYMGDFNKAMAEHAEVKGVPSSALSIGPEFGDIRRLFINGRRVKGGELDLIFSHSVLWNIENYERFFAEASRTLKPSGVLSVSTVRANAFEAVEYFAENIAKDLQIAVLSGDITQDQADEFVLQNQRGAEQYGVEDSIFKNYMTAEIVGRMAQKYGFEVVDISDCYVVETPSGSRPLFIQFQLRKK